MMMTAARPGCDGFEREGEGEGAGMAASTSVGELAEEIGLTAGLVLDTCEALSINANGRYSVLSAPDLARVRAELARQGTRRESGAAAGAGPRGTRRDGESTGTGTRRETGQDQSGWEVHLPAVLAARFEFVRQLHHGGEGFVMLVRRHGDDQLVVLKGYHAGFDVDPTSLEVLSQDDIGLDHVVKILEYGTLPDGAFYEVQEYCQHGSLRELMLTNQPLDLARVITELVAAVSYVHGLGIVHRDIKPENILVRTTHPLGLVIADFGLIRQLDGSVRRTTRAGTAEYSPPEGVSHNVDVSAAWDWWSLGMIVAELAGGTHPLALPDGSFPSPDEMRAELAQQPVPLDAVADERLRLLCSGLLVRDRRQRWAEDETHRWLNGESPPVVDDSPATSSHIPRVSVLFEGIEYDTPAELAARFQSRWPEAMSLLFQDPDPGLVEETTALCRSSGNDRAADLLGATPTGGDVVRHMARLLAAMEPTLNPTFDGIDVTPAGLEAAAIRVLATDDTGMAEKLRSIERGQILRIWRHLPGMQEATVITERWKHLQEQANEHMSDQINNHPLTLQRVRAAVLLGALDARHITDLATRLKPDDDVAREISWWCTLVDCADPISQLIATVSQPLARAEGAAAQEQRRQEQDRERQRKERARRDEVRRRQEQVEAEKAERRASRPQDIIELGGWFISTLVMSFLAWCVIGPGIGFLVLRPLGLPDTLILGPYALAFVLIGISNWR